MPVLVCGTASLPTFLQSQRPFWNQLCTAVYRYVYVNLHTVGQNMYRQGQQQGAREGYMCTSVDTHNVDMSVKQSVYCSVNVLTIGEKSIAQHIWIIHSRL